MVQQTNIREISGHSIVRLKEAAVMLALTPKYLCTLECQGLKRVTVRMLLGMTLYLLTYSLPPVFEALGEIISFELRDAHTRMTE